MALLRNLRTGEYADIAGEIPPHAIEVIDRGHEIGAAGREERVRYDGQTWVVVKNRSGTVGIGPE